MNIDIETFSLCLYIFENSTMQFLKVIEEKMGIKYNVLRTTEPILFVFSGIAKGHKTISYD